MTKIAIDSDIFFFTFRSSRADVNPPDVERRLRALSNNPRVDLFVPISVIGECVIECLREECHPRDQRGVREIDHLTDLWAGLDLKFLYPNELVAEVCYQLVERYKTGYDRDRRLTDTDLVHIGYALAHEMDYFLTTDKALKHYIPQKAKLKVLNLEEIKDLF